MAIDSISPTLWADTRTIDDSFTLNRESDRDFAMWRAYRSVGIANTSGCEFVNLWLSRDGIFCYESKNIVASVSRIKEALNKILGYDKSVKLLLEPKPTISTERSFLPTIGHAIGLSLDTIDQARVGVSIQVAGSIITTSGPVFEIGFANSFNKLWGIRLDDQSGLGYSQDKIFGVESIRRAFNITKILVENNCDGFIGIDTKAMRTQKTEDCDRHLYNTINIIEMLEKKVGEFDDDFQSGCIKEKELSKT